MVIKMLDELGRQMDEYSEEINNVLENINNLNRAEEYRSLKKDYTRSNL